MAIFRCKMCGGDLNVQGGASTCVCEFCGTEQTIPTLKDENLQGLFNRANVLRIKAEFDKAADLYEKIIQSDETEAEAYWGLILCKYGIEYVEDPVTHGRIPTCHRASYEPVVSDEDYKNAIKYADVVQRTIYEREARSIDEIQKGILALAQSETPYDVFICYKESDDSGNRTQDSVIANDIYHQLTQEGIKVFYAAISLEDKIGSDYEPYIFSALNTAKVMLVLGTRPEYFSAVWVKNEWSRFLRNVQRDRSKLLIPCYRDMDPYELPEEFSHLQAQDMSKIGFINDLLRGIRKILSSDKVTSVKPESAEVTPMAGNVGAFLKRGKIALEDGEWKAADGFYEEVLNQDPECAEAYLGKYMARERIQEKAGVFLLSEEDALNYTPETLEGCAEAVEQVEAAISEYGTIVPENKIRELYKYDRTFSSVLSAKKRAKEEIVEGYKGDRLLSRAMRYATGDLKVYFESELRRLTEELDRRIALSEENDEKNRERITADYAAHQASAEKDVRALYEDEIAEKEGFIRTA